MDIEGHEVSVFEGAYNYFKENDGETHILLEVHPQYYDENNDFAAILEKYYDIGFKIKYLVSTPYKHGILLRIKKEFKSSSALQFE